MLAQAEHVVPSLVVVVPADPARLIDQTEARRVIQAIVPATQRRMIANVGCERVVSMDTSHSPFFSAPQTLAQHLATLAG